ncbi:MAG: extracellular solute-binding protein [Planctomycetia bacterium]|jgi:ABC-type glycerol-3-phosphate transport system substrate-binding protein
MNRFLQIVVLVVLLPVLVGCPDTKQPDEADQESTVSLDGVKLTLAINGDEPLADAIEKLAGEWKAQTGSELKVVRLDTNSVDDLKKADADALITASHMLGALADSKMIVPLERSVLEADPSHWVSTFEIPRLTETTWGETLYGISFGSPVLVCYYRPDLFEKLGLDPPKTWDEYEAAAKKLSDREKLGDLVTVSADQWHATAEPYGGDWAAITFLARAAPLAKHRDNYSTLFNCRTMEPLLIAPPMLDTLTQMVRTSQYAADPKEATDPDATRRLFWEGRVAMALTWPTATAELPEAVKASPVPMAIAPLPGSRDVYNIDEGKEEKRDKDQSWQVPLLGIAGRLGTVCQSSKNQAAAVRLLLWLSGSTSRPVPASRSQATTFYRRSQVPQIQQWTESPISSEAADHYAEVTKATMQSEQWVFALRIPGRDEYLATLSDSVREAMKGKQPPEALMGTMQRWMEITRDHKKEKPLHAYRSSLGLER